MKNFVMSLNENNSPFNGMNIIKKIGLCLLVALIITFYILCFQFLSI
ncbi:hypothetical protein H4V97_001077 [Flavobacterium sp. CG_23.5]|nr:hypothetical protein [Flavobacterium sp. CG_9.10]MBP2282759.1 hypothetical protein [Flavobacterium sp. CG_23.5]